MMDGIFFYWFSWMFWVITTFFMRKNRQRTLFSCWILISIICSNLYVTSDIFDVSLTFLIVFCGAFVLFAIIPKKVFHLLASFTIMIGYTSILLWEKYIPVWMLGPRLIIIPLLCVLIITIIANGFYARLVTGLIGMCGGELLHGVMLANYHVQKSIGDMAFFDSILIVLFFLICLDFLQKAILKAKASFVNHKQSLRWQNE